MVAVITRSAARTKQLGCMMGRLLRAGDMVALTGELGTGKTVMIKGIATGLGINERDVTSPTFTLMNEYRGRAPRGGVPQSGLTLYHLDAYRVKRAAEMEELGADDCFFGEGVCVIEWADHAAEYLPSDRLDIAAEHVDEKRRYYEMRATGPRSTAILNKLKEVLSRKRRGR